MTYYILSAVTFMIVLVGLGLYRTSRFEKKLWNRVDLVLRASHLCTSRVSNACKKLDEIKQERSMAFDHQRKSSEHQRVLLASLNRQLQHLEQQLSLAGDIPPVQNDHTDVLRQLAAQGRDRGIPDQFAGRKKTESKISKSEHGIVRLEEMFRTASKDAGITSTRDMRGIRRTPYSELDGPVNERLESIADRRVSYG